MFRRLDKDNGQSLSPEEVRGEDPIWSLYRIIDRDGDGRLVMDELEAGTALLEALSQGQVKFGIADRGMSLFGNLDANSDDRLSHRELREVSARLATFDHDRDGALSAAEIPHRFAWVLSQAPHAHRGHRP